MLPTTWMQRMPWGLLLAATGLLALGWIGIARGEELGDGDGRFVHQQVLWSLVAAGAALARHDSQLPVARPLREWRSLRSTLLLLVAVYFFPEVHGTQRWIRVGPVGLQPSEFAKLVFVLGAGSIFDVGENYRRFRGLLVPVGPDRGARHSGTSRAGFGNVVGFPACVVCDAVRGRGSENRSGGPGPVRRRAFARACGRK